MSKLKALREQQNLTQEELSEKSGVSVRTIQRIEAGRDPKGHTLRALGKSLGIPDQELLNKHAEIKGEAQSAPVDYNRVKLINLAALPFTVFPPANILVPLVLMFALKQKNLITKQIISVQIMWTIFAPIVFMIGIFLKLGNQFTLVLIILLVLTNVFIVLRNAAEIDRRQTLYYKLNFRLL
ncbi:MAG: DNA-binding protein [Bacteroidetes bacterium RIFCSPHIGHO2_02_FULL_44_7]|nr:MAG: DNA-binding protein [Bacteroidetes bacterium RIFCSPHIGHO2_02_FULL_44_7]